MKKLTIVTVLFGILSIGALIIGAKAPENKVESGFLPATYETSPQVLTGPGAYSLETNGDEDTTYYYTLNPITFDKTIGTLVEVKIQRIGSTYPAIKVDYAAEYTLTTTTVNYSHRWIEKGWYSFSTFDDFAPPVEDQFDTDPAGWTYIWPETSPYSTTMGAYDGTTDYTGTTGYNGVINGVTNTSVWDSTTTPRKVGYFVGNGITTKTLYYTPRIADYVVGGSPQLPLGHWGVNITDVDFNINTISIVYVYTIP